MFTLLKQGDPQWGNATIGSTKLTLRRFGCTITSLSMTMSYFRDDFKTPDELAKKLQFTTEGLLIWESLPQVVYLSLETTLLEYDQKFIDASIADPKRAVILEVNDGQHFVLGIRRIPLTKTYLVADPLTGTRRFYSNVCGSRHFISL